MVESLNFYLKSCGVLAEDTMSGEGSIGKRSFQPRCTVFLIVLADAADIGKIIPF